MRRFLLFAVCIAALQLSADHIIAENGKTVFTIVRSDKMAGILQKELHNFAATLGQVTGAKFRITTESQAPAAGSRIYFGDTRFARKAGIDEAAMSREMIVLKSCGSDIIITGKERIGKLFALYEFLERFAHCRYYDEYNVVIPRVAELTVPELNIRRAPSFAMRRIFTGTGKTFANGFDISLPLKYSFSKWNDPVYGRPGDIHTFYAFTKEWPKDNLKLLSMTPQGKRRRLVGRIGPNFCLTNPEARKLFKEKLYQFIAADRARAAKNKTAPPQLYNISQNDSSRYFCCCPDCSAIIKKHGNSGLLLTFINELARAVAKDYPDILIQTCAYSFSNEPPKGGITAEKNVIVDLAHNAGNYYAPIETEKDPEFRNQLSGWNRASQLLSIWDYWIFYWDSYPEPYCNVRHIKKNLDCYYRHGVRMLRVESQAADTASFYTLKHYLGYKLMDDMTRDDRELISDFMKGYYGAAAAEMEEYLDYLTARQQGQEGKIFKGPYPQYKTPPRPWLDREFHTKVEEILNRAEAKTAGDPRTLLNVKRERLVIDSSLLRIYDTIKPAVSRKKLIERYAQNRAAFIRARYRKSAQPHALLQLDNELEMFRRASDIAALKNSPAPSLTVKRSAEFPPVQAKFLDNRGFPGKRDISLQSRLSADGRIFFIRLTDHSVKSKLTDHVNLWLGNCWEIMLASGDRKKFFQMMIPPSGKYLAGMRNPGFEKMNIAGIKVKSSFSASGWVVDITLDLDKLPLKNIDSGNFYRNGGGFANAWSPTFEANFGVPERFGMIKFERK